MSVTWPTRDQQQYISHIETYLVILAEISHKLVPVVSSFLLYKENNYMGLYKKMEQSLSLMVSRKRDVRGLLFPCMILLSAVLY